MHSAKRALYAALEGEKKGLRYSTDDMLQTINLPDDDDTMPCGKYRIFVFLQLNSRLTLTNKRAFLSHSFIFISIVTYIEEQ